MIFAIKRRLLDAVFFSTVLAGSSFAYTSSMSDSSSQRIPSSALGSSREPRLLSGGKVEFPAQLVKKGVAGTIEIRINIDQRGAAESCELDRGLHPLLDSLVLSAMRTAFSEVNGSL